MRLCRLTATLPVFALLVACAGTPDNARSPLVTLDSVEPAPRPDQVLMQLKLKNRGDSVMPVTGLRYRLELNDVEFAWGFSRQSVDVPAHGEAVFSITVPGRLPGTEPGQTRLRYNLSGMIQLADDRRESSFVQDGVLNWQDAAGP